MLPLMFSMASAHAPSMDHDLWWGVARGVQRVRVLIYRERGRVSFATFRLV